MTDKDLIEELWQDLKQKRDELRVQIELGKAELQDEWHEMEKKLSSLETKIDPALKEAGDVADDVWEAAKLLGEEIKEGFTRIKNRL